MNRRANRVRSRVRAGLPLAVTLAVAGFSRGADFVAVNISPAPDTLVRFDTANPGAADASAPLATLSGNFVRGIDLTGPGDGWYVCAAPLDGSPTGLFRLQLWESTRIGDVPFESTSTGGLTLNRAHTFLYFAIDPPDARPDTLFKVNFDGVWTEIGPITVAGDPDPTIAGLACDPLSGALYALENDADALLRIDPADGSAVAIGAGLGIAANGAGGMDFEPAPPYMLYIATNSGWVYVVDPLSGIAGPALGQLPFVTSSIAALPGPAPCDACDVNCDGSTNGGDIQPFLEMLTGGIRDCSPCAGDVDGNGSVNGQDIASFVACLVP